MSSLVAINAVEVELEVVGDQTYTTSLTIASVFNKRHDNILAQIRAFPQYEFTALNFKVSEYKDKSGRKLPMYQITKDGFVLLAMGFTGEKAYKFKIEYIKAFNAMAEEIKRLKFEKYINEIADLNACLIDKAKRHRREINGYKSQLVQRGKQITILKHELAKFENKNKRYEDISYENLKALYHNTLLDLEYYKKKYKEKEKKERVSMDFLTQIQNGLSNLNNYIYED